MRADPLWFSLFTNAAYKSDEKPFADISSVPGIKNLQENYPEILQELEEYLVSHKMLGHFNATMVDAPQSWKVRSLKVWSVEMYEVQEHFKKTMNLLNAVPGIINIGFNVLEPGAKIKPHGGDTNAIIRCHMGLKVPAPAPTCALKVKGEERGWENGKILAFMDAFEHEAWNLSGERRIILLFDILRPEYRERKNKICATILTSLYLQNIGNFWPGLYKMNRKIFRIALWPFILFLQMAIPLRNSLKK
ncbi:MAG TPA: aspartyl/asparaginyl beta-hydroxylase domain-containing protein [Bacteroidia bacterium]|nr:aspartyl/asparaginyl beta-hydroxylase domain-containing protein [Bacteroidia bacterium]